MQLLQRFFDFLFERAFVQLTKYLFLFVLLLPGLVPAVLQLLLFEPGSVNPVLWLTLNRLDAGFQLGVGGYILRAWLLVLAGLAVLIGVQVPSRGRTLWLLFWGFVLVATISALVSSHPFEALVCAGDTALLGVVILLAMSLAPRNWYPNALCVAASAVAALSLDVYVRFPQDDGRLTGCFHQPNMTATYMAATLPWLMNQILAGSRRPALRVLGFVALVLVLTTMLLTGTRAAWMFTTLCLAGRWWLGGRLSRRSAGLGDLLGVGVVMLISLLLYWQGSQSWVGFLAAFVWLALLALWSRRSLSAWGWLLAGCLMSYGAFHFLHSLQPPKVHLEERVLELSKGTDDSVSSRLEFWRSALLMGLDHPWLGVGPRGFHRYYPKYQLDQRWFSKYAHSATMSCWAEVGVIGFGLFVALALLFSWHIWKGLQRLSASRDPNTSAALSFLLDSGASVAILSLCIAVDVQWQFPSLIVTWACWIGLSLGLAWPEPPLEQAPPTTLEVDETIHPWTLRPRVVICYTLISLLGVASALNLCWGFAQYYFDLSDELLKRGKVAEAIQCDQQCIRLNPFQATYYHHLGLSYTAALSYKAPPVKPSDYLQVAERAVALDSHRAVHYDLLAKACRANKLMKESNKALHRAVELDPVNYPSFYNSLADMLAPEDRIQRERILMSCVERFAPESLGKMFTFRSEDIQRQMIETYILMAELSDPGRNPELAIGYYDRLLKIQPQDIAGQMGRIVCLINLNRLPAARKEALNLYRQAPRSETLDLLEHIYQFEKLPFDPKQLPPVVDPKVVPGSQKK